MPKHGIASSITALPLAAGDDLAASPRSVRRATAERASGRRHVARELRRDPDAMILAFLRDHAGSTVGDLVKGLDLGYEVVAGRLVRLGGTGEVERTAHGFRICG